jgi:uncharacterized coiled-coil DUF342 family protein
LIVVAVVGLGWWGMREAKKEINNQMNKYEPTLDSMKENADRFSKEGEEWQKKSEEFRNAMPDPEELQKEMEKNSPAARPY